MTNKGLESVVRGQKLVTMVEADELFSNDEFSKKKSNRNQTNKTTTHMSPQSSSVEVCLVFGVMTWCRSPH